MIVCTSATLRRGSVAVTSLSVRLTSWFTRPVDGRSNGPGDAAAKVRRASPSAAPRAGPGVLVGEPRPPVRALGVGGAIGVHPRDVLDVARVVPVPEQRGHVPRHRPRPPRGPAPAA